MLVCVLYCTLRQEWEARTAALKLQAKAVSKKHAEYVKAKALKKSKAKEEAAILARALIDVSDTESEEKDSDAESENSEEPREDNDGGDVAADAAFDSDEDKEDSEDERVLHCAPVNALSCSCSLCLKHAYADYLCLCSHISTCVLQCLLSFI
jgi:hypothetical protein